MLNGHGISRRNHLSLFHLGIVSVVVGFVNGEGKILHCLRLCRSGKLYGFLFRQRHIHLNLYIIQGLSALVSEIHVVIHRIGIGSHRGTLILSHHKGLSHCLSSGILHLSAFRDENVNKLGFILGLASSRNIIPNGKGYAEVTVTGISAAVLHLQCIGTDIYLKG